MSKGAISKYSFFLFLNVIGILNSFSQNSNPKPGDRIHESISLYDTENKVRQLKIPQDDYLLVFKYRWVEAGMGVDNKDSIKILEAKIADMLADGEIKNLKVICISYEKGTEYNNWLQKMKTEKPFRENSKYKVEYYNVNGDPVSEAKCKKLFSRIALFGPDGRILVYTKYIEKFSYAFKNDYIKVKAKLLSDNSVGVKEPMNNAKVHVGSTTNDDTLAKATTNKNGDFELSLPNNEKEYLIEVESKDKNTKNVSLITMEGREIAILEKNGINFKYKILKAEIIYLSETPLEDISLKYELFNSSKKNELITAENIFYESKKSNIRDESKPILNKVIKILNDNPTVTLEIISHTDAQGDDESNLILSEKRAKSVEDYIVKAGISASRLKSGGKGETEIRNRCKNGVNCSDKEHEYNRRTEFKFTRP